MIRKSIKQSIELAIRLTVGIGVGITRCLPVRLWLRIRDAAQIVSRTDYHRYPIRMAVDSRIENDLRIHESAKEPTTVEWIEKWFEPGEVLYDIGANVGSYSLIANGFLRGNVRAFAFEPGFVTFPQLCRNIHLNDAGSAIVPFQIALSDRTRVEAFHYQNLVTGGALHALGEPVDQFGETFEPVCTLPTLTYRLDDFVRQFDLPLPNHIKIDVDGVESQILKGAKDVLAFPGLRSLLFEVAEGSDAVEIAELLADSRLILHHEYGDESLFVKDGAA